MPKAEPSVHGIRSRRTPSCICHDETGLLVPQGDAGSLARAIETLMQNPERATQMGAAARKRAVERFSWGKIAERTLEVYTMAIRSARGLRK